MKLVVCPLKIEPILDANPFEHMVTFALQVDPPRSIANLKLPPPCQGSPATCRVRPVQSQHGPSTEVGWAELDAHAMDKFLTSSAEFKLQIEMGRPSQTRLVCLYINIQACSASAGLSQNGSFAFKYHV